MYMCICVCIYIYIYIEREREIRVYGGLGTARKGANGFSTNGVHCELHAF